MLEQVVVTAESDQDQSSGLETAEQYDDSSDDDEDEDDAKRRSSSKFLTGASQCSCFPVFNIFKPKHK